MVGPTVKGTEKYWEMTGSCTLAPVEFNLGGLDSSNKMGMGMG